MQCGKCIYILAYQAYLGSGTNSPAKVQYSVREYSVPNLGHMYDVVI